MRAVPTRADAILRRLERARHVRPGAGEARRAIASARGFASSDPERLIRFHEALLFLRAYPHDRRVRDGAERLLRTFARRVRGARGRRRGSLALRRSRGRGHRGNDDRDGLLLRRRALARAPVPAAGPPRLGRRRRDRPDARELAAVSAAPRGRGARRRQRRLPRVAGRGRGTPAQRSGLASRALRAAAASPRRPRRALRLPGGSDLLGPGRRPGLADADANPRAGALLSRRAVSFAPGRLAGRHPVGAAAGPAPALAKRRANESAIGCARRRPRATASSTRSPTRIRPRSSPRVRGGAWSSFSSASSRSVGCRCARPTAASSSRTACRSGTSRVSPWPSGSRSGSTCTTRSAKGESAWIYAQVLKLHKDALGVTSFSIDPYQLGFENDEALDSGAFWFYRKLGFRPTNAGRPPAARARGTAHRGATRRTAPRAERSSGSSSETSSTTRRGRRRAPGTASMSGGIGLAVNRRMRKRRSERGPVSREGGDACRASLAALAAVVVARASAPPSPSFALVLVCVPDLGRWSAAERAAAVDVVRAKAARRRAALSPAPAPARTPFAACSSDLGSA